MPASYSSLELALGYEPNGLSISATTLALNTATTYLAYGFTAHKTDTIDEVRAFISAVTGTVAAANITCGIYADSSGSPGSVVGTEGTLSATPTAAAWNTFTGISASVTAGTAYFIVFKNVNGTPASDSVTFRFATALPPWSGQGNIYGPRKCHTTDGSTWGTFVGNSFSARIHYSSTDHYAGFPVDTPVAWPSGERVFGANYTGVKFTTPANATLNVKRVAFQAYKASTPSGNLGVKIFDSGHNLVATSTLIPPGNVDTSPRWLRFTFSSVVQLTGNTQYYALLFDDAADSSSAYFLGYKLPFDTNANSAALMPFDGTLRMVKSGDSGASTSDVTGYILPFLLFADAYDAFVGGSGQSFSYGFCG